MKEEQDLVVAGVIFAVDKRRARSGGSRLRLIPGHVVDDCRPYLELPLPTSG
jgi:hypothetical protein